MYAKSNHRKAVESVIPADVLRNLDSLRLRSRDGKPSCVVCAAMPGRKD